MRTGWAARFAWLRSVLISAAPACKCDGVPPGSSCWWPLATGHSPEKIELSQAWPQPGPVGSYRKCWETQKTSTFLLKVVWETNFKDFTWSEHCQKDRNNIPDPFGYESNPFYFDKHPKTLIFMFAGFSKCHNWAVHFDPNFLSSPFVYINTWNLTKLLNQNIHVFQAEDLWILIMFQPGKLSILRITNRFSELNSFRRANIFYGGPRSRHGGELAPDLAKPPPWTTVTHRLSKM